MTSRRIQLEKRVARDYAVSYLTLESIRPTRRIAAGPASVCIDTLRHSFVVAYSHGAMLNGTVSECVSVAKRWTRAVVARCATNTTMNARHASKTNCEWNSVCYSRCNTQEQWAPLSTSTAIFGASKHSMSKFRHVSVSGDARLRIFRRFTVNRWKTLCMWICGTRKAIAGKRIKNFTHWHIRNA